MKVTVWAQLSQAEITGHGVEMKNGDVELVRLKFGSGERIPVRLLGPDGTKVGEGFATLDGTATFDVTDEEMAHRLAPGNITAFSIGVVPDFRAQRRYISPPTRDDIEIADGLRKMLSGPKPQSMADALSRIVEATRHDHTDEEAQLPRPTAKEIVDSMRQVDDYYANRGFHQPDDAKRFTVVFDVDVSRGAPMPANWKRGIRVEVIAPDEATAAFLAGWLIGGVPRPIENVKVELSA